MRRIVYAAFALTVLAACQPASTELTDYQKHEIAAEVELLHGQFWEAWRVYDGRGMSYYRDSPEFTFALDGQLLNGFDAVNDAVQSSDVATQEITFNEVQITVLAPDVVCTMEQGTYTETDADGATGPETAFAFTAIWVRSDSEWKVHFAHASTPTPETP
jgi:heat shock protein HslJ